MNTITQHLKHPFMIGAGVIVVFAAAGSYAYYRSGTALPQYRFTDVRTAAITEVVRSTGTVKPAEAVDLGFMRSGRVVRVAVLVGDRVQAGDVLVALDSANLASELAQAEATANGERANLAQLEQGARSEDVAVTQAQVSVAEQGLAALFQSVPATVRDAYNKADDAVRKQLDGFFSNAETNPQLTFTVSDTQAQSDAVWQRQKMSVLLNDWNDSLSPLGASSTQDMLVSSLGTATSDLAEVNAFLDRVGSVLTSQVSLSSVTADAYRAAVGTARSEIVAGVNEVTALASELATQQAVVLQAERSLALKVASATPEAVAAQESRVAAAAAAADNVRAELRNTVILAPFAGVVARSDAKVGEIATPNVPVISLISLRQFQIDAYVPEADIAKVAAEEEARVTLDAYGSDVVFPARVISLEGVPTMSSGSPTYKTTLEFETDDSRIKAGLTANVVIAAAAKPHAIVIPERDVMRRGDARVVLIDTRDSQPVAREVQLGIEGEDGMVEVLSGLSAGDRIVDFGSN